MLLKDVPPGQYCIVDAMNLPPELSRRLEALGMTKHTLISVLRRKGKGVVVIRLRGSRFALGSAITNHIEVR